MDDTKLDLPNLRRYFGKAVQTRGAALPVYRIEGALNKPDFLATARQTGWMHRSADPDVRHDPLIYAGEGNPDGHIYYNRHLSDLIDVVEGGVEEGASLRLLDISPGYSVLWIAKDGKNQFVNCFGAPPQCITPMAEAEFIKKINAEFGGTLTQSAAQPGLEA